MNDNSPTADGIAEESSSSRPLEDNLKSRNTWMRLVFMVVYYLLISVASIVASVIVVLGFLAVLFTGERNRQLMQAGATVTSYIADILSYLTFNTDEKPFPFGKDLGEDD